MIQVLLLYGMVFQVAQDAAQVGLYIMLQAILLAKTFKLVSMKVMVRALSQGILCKQLSIQDLEKYHAQ